MHVLFVPRPDWKTAFGGDAVQMQATAKRLRALDVELDIARPEDADLASYDVIHLWTSLQMPAELLSDVRALQSARAAGVKLVHSPVWAPQHTLRWMSVAREWLFSRHADLAAMTLESAQHDLQQIAARAPVFKTQHGEHRAFEGEPSAPVQRAAIAQIDMILPNSWMELQAICEYIGIANGFHIVPNAVDAELFSREPDVALPAELQDVPFAMMSARFDSRKQQDFVMLALKDLDIPLVFVGGVAEQPIFDRFRQIGSRRKAPVYYFGRMEHTSLRVFYREARVHFLPSLFESPGLSSIEAALLDCTIVAGALGFEVEYFREQAYYCDPCDAWSIGNAVGTAFAQFEADQTRRAAQHARIREEYTWERAARETLDAYRRVCGA